ncbi:MAG: hypothetical protein CSA81_11560 [Acidobacteria bacterium]|nr:MAG: hypothetical protein CSA81_11560 [Acidobacteriota bacterium]
MLAAWSNLSVASPSKAPQPKQPQKRLTGKGDLALDIRHDAEIYLDGESKGKTESGYILIEGVCTLRSAPCKSGNGDTNG